MISTARPIVALLVLLAPTFATAAEGKETAGFAGVQADGYAIVTVNVAQLWDAEELKPVHAGLAKIKSDLTKGFEHQYGLKIEEVERITYYWSSFTEDDRRPEPFRIVTARKPFDRSKLVKAMGAQPAEDIADKEVAPWVARLAGKNVFFRHTAPIIFADDRTLIFGPYIGPEDVHVSDYLKVLGGTTPKVSEGPLAEALALAGKHTVVAAIDFSPVRKALADGPALPAEFEPLAAMAQAERGLFTFDFGPIGSAAAKITFFDGATAEKIEPEGKKVIALALDILDEIRKRKGRDAEAEPLLLPLLDFAKSVLESADLKRDGKAISMTISGTIAEPAKKALAQLAPRVDAMEERMKSTRNLGQISIALHSYTDEFGSFPQNIVDQNGKAILSWRVHVLKHCDEALYKKIDLAKPWDDAANKKYVEQMPEAFKYYGGGRVPKEKGFTYFQMCTSPEPTEGGNPFLVPGRKLDFLKLSDGCSNTLMVIEGEAAVNWLKPGDLAWSSTKLPKLGNPKTGKFLAGFADGHVRWLDSRMLSEKTLHALITVDGGEILGDDFE